MIKENYIGNCVDSFDEDGQCVIGELGYDDVTNFAQDEEDYEKIAYKDFIRNVGQIPPYIRKNLSKSASFFRSQVQDNLFIIYDDDSDIHYFFKSD